MKKYLKTAAGVLAAAALALALPGLIIGRAEAETPDALRLHILANSDSEEDQEVKLRVRDAILELFEGGLGAQTKAEAYERMLAIGPEIQSAAERVLYENGCEQTVTLETGEFDFPERTYGEEIYPAGRYSALRVILGSGEGHNWWCVMFPPLCVIDDGSGVQMNDNGTLAFRSLIADFWRRLFG